MISCAPICSTWLGVPAHDLEDPQGGGGQRFSPSLFSDLSFLPLLVPLSQLPLLSLFILILHVHLGKYAST